MTIEEKRDALTTHCANCERCSDCLLLTWEPADGIPCDFTVNGWPDRMIIGGYNLLFPITSTVDHPGHYNREGAMECIDEMVLIFGREAVMHFCLCNAWKYRYRAADKNGQEDLKKSDWYIAKYKELKGGEQS